jgi:hypothetical protein
MLYKAYSSVPRSIAADIVMLLIACHVLPVLFQIRLFDPVAVKQTLYEDHLKAYSEK